ncbi:uncharacterized protein LOC119724902 [Patiria miniata]|uniref:Uncharacterized protein n=1 Tax=Patiria miniata TaxID=46514 RepID=A0A913ZM01_PATMI|nr:uncharacterized protein LOC119724902 [Patiria miniata]
MTTLHAVDMGAQTQVVTHHQPQQQQQQTITYQTVHAQPQQGGNVMSNYSGATARQTGYAQVTCGVLAVAIGIAAIVLECRLSYVSSPIWSGIGFFVVAGILGIASAANQNNCVIVGHLVMSILASLAAFQMMIMLIIAALTEYKNCRYEYNIYGPYQRNCDNYYYGRIAVDSIGGVVALVEFVVAIIASAICCRGSCGSGTIASQQTVVHHYVPNQGNVTIMTNPQPYGQAAPQQQGYVQQPHPMAPPQGYSNQAFSHGPQTSQGAPPIHAPPPYNYAEEKGKGMPIAEA